METMNNLIEWPAGPLETLIEPGAVHTWAWDFACSKEDLDDHVAVLSQDEKMLMQRFHFEEDRTRYALCRSLCRRLLGRYLRSSPTSIRFTKNCYGKPYLSPDFASSKLHFSLSHTHRLALLAIAMDQTVGVDVEELRPIEVAVAEQCFSAREKVELSSLEGPDWLEGFYNCWTRKEAILKAEGIGLNVKLDAFDVTLHPEASAALLAFQASAGITWNWHLSKLQPGPLFVGTLATSRVPKEIACYHLVR